MADEQPGNGEQARGGKRASPRGRKGRHKAEDLAADAYNDYAAALGEAWEAADLAEDIPDALDHYFDRLREESAADRTADRQAAVLLSYLRLARSYLDPEQDNLEAYRNYVDELSEQSRPAEQSPAGEAYRAYLDAVEKALAPDEFEKRSNKAWETYLRQLQQ